LSARTRKKREGGALRTDYGQPVNGIFQYAYVVEDLEQAVREYELLGVGPWYLTDSFSPAAARYRGKPTQLTAQLAFAYCGSVQIELVKQHDDSPSVFREVVERRGYGFHHFGLNTTDFDASVARLQKAGYQEAYYDVFGDNVRVMYFDTTDRLPGMTEFIELSPGWEALQTAMWSASLNWDGSRPIRPFSEVAGG
jgi:4-hydroxyphenylpyruvate dioxygenase-like putative hemolysin